MWYIYVVVVKHKSKAAQGSLWLSLIPKHGDHIKALSTALADISMWIDSNRDAYFVSLLYSAFSEWVKVLQICW